MLEGTRGGPAVAPPSPRRSAAASERRDDVLKVSTRSRPSAVAGAIAGVIRQTGAVEVQTIGAGATNQAIKAIVIARSYLHEEGLELAFVPVFMDVVIDTQERTGLRLFVEQRRA
jgi:stage V sporulation protein S